MERKAINLFSQYPVFQAVVTDKEEGVAKISFVKSPAIMTNFISLSAPSNEKKVRLQFNDEKRIVYGPLLIPNQMIYRKDGDYEYYMYYADKTIENISQKFMKEGKLADFNIEHITDVEGSYVVENWLVEDSESDKAVKLGFETPAKGTWFIGAKIENDELWEEIKQKQYEGFSIEGFFSVIEMKQETQQTEGFFSKVKNKLFGKGQEGAIQLKAEKDIAGPDGKVLVKQGDLWEEIKGVGGEKFLINLYDNKIIQMVENALTEVADGVYEIPEYNIKIQVTGGYVTNTIVDGAMLYWFNEVKERAGMEVDPEPAKKEVKQAAQLGQYLSTLVDGKDTLTRDEVVTQLAEATGVSVEDINFTLNGETGCPTLDLLGGFATYFNVELQTIIDAANNDGCSYDADEVSARQTSINEAKSGSGQEDPAPEETQENSNVKPTTEVNMATHTLDDGTMIEIDDETNEAWRIDETGARQGALGDGTYTLDDGTEITIAEGRLVVEDNEEDEESTDEAMQARLSEIEDNVNARFNIIEEKVDAIVDSISTLLTVLENSSDGDTLTLKANLSSVKKETEKQKTSIKEDRNSFIQLKEAALRGKNKK